ncbi:MAG: N-formylglutamate amidohydrolase [Rhodospirillales bacterium]|nr:N-formylglutamate amidohydrolase [Rhodospirillales bacterium]
MSDKSIPGVLTYSGPVNGTVPVIFDSPHSGIEYPDDFDYSVAEDILRMGEDTYIEELYGAAPDLGAGFLQAHFPRSYVDPNRTILDIDQELLSEPWPGEVTPSIKTESGIGLIWRVARPGYPIYKRSLSVAEVQARIDTYHQPYQDALMTAVAETKEKFGAVWHINCHSMPGVSDERSPEGPGIERAQFCLGDRDGTTCSFEFTNFVAEQLRGMGYGVALNDPFKGVELVRMVGAPDQGRHSLQIEINRNLILNDRSKEKVAEFETLRANLTKLIGAIGEFATSEANSS